MKHLFTQMKTPKWGKLNRLLNLWLVLIVALFILRGSVTPQAEDIEDRAQVYTRGLEFDFVAWTLDALRLKFFETALTAPAYMTLQQQRLAVAQYIDLTTNIFSTEYEIQNIYSDPTIDDPQSASAELRRELAGLQEQRRQRAVLGEAVLQDQVNQVAAEFGLTLGGETIPPVLFHTTPLPMLLIISPRAIIRQDGAINLMPDMGLDQRVALEDQVATALNVSTLVEYIGGVGTYPTMVQRTNNLNWLTEVVSHEWIHNYLTLRPLGVLVEKNAELRIMNETTASIAGKEMGLRLIEIYYPELLPPPAPPTPPAQPTAAAPVEPPPAPVFDFNREMHLTRVETDALLQAGKIEEAEAYMEARRKIFWDNGYKGLRKLNQAYFAFHGNYADQPMGAAGTNPVGAAVRQLRAQSPSLAAFLQTISRLTSYAALQAALKGTTP